MNVLTGEKGCQILVYWLFGAECMLLTLYHIYIPDRVGYRSSCFGGDSRLSSNPLFGEGGGGGGEGGREGGGS